MSRRENERKRETPKSENKKTRFHPDDRSFVGENAETRRAACTAGVIVATLYFPFPHSSKYKEGIWILCSEIPSSGKMPGNGFS